MSVPEVRMNDDLVDTSEKAPQDEDDEELDPRIKENLDLLNFASDTINRLEKDLDEVRQANRLALSEFGQQCQTLKKKFGKSIRKSAPYFEARRLAKKAHTDNQRAASAFEKASDHHKGAKERVAVAEREFLTPRKDGGKPVFDSAWQDALNDATEKVMVAEKARIDSEAEYQKTAQAYDNARRKVQQLLSKYRSSITKSSVFFETRVKFLQQFEKYKRQAISLQADIKDAKAQYGQALENLEAISIEIHEGRQAKKLQETIEKERPRNMGDGAEDLQAELDEVDGAARKLAMSLGVVGSQSGSPYMSMSSLEDLEGADSLGADSSEGETPSTAPSSRRISGESDVSDLSATARSDSKEPVDRKKQSPTISKK